MKVRIGTRGSDLALWQARFVAAGLRAAGHEVEIIVLRTRGDRITDIPLDQVEGKAFFTAEIERALLERAVDVAVHSYKDLATESVPGLTIAAVPARAASHERLLIDPAHHDPGGALLPLARGARVGTSAPRRREQLSTLRPDVRTLDLRGNVPTRVERLREGRYDAIVLAAAGLDRLELPLEGLVVVDLRSESFVPAPAQGALAVQTRSDDAVVHDLCRSLFHDEYAAACALAERELFQSAGRGCSLPLGASVWTEAGRAHARVFVGVDHPSPGCPPRWIEASGDDIDAAKRAALSGIHGTPGAADPSSTCAPAGPLAGVRVAAAGTLDSAERVAARLRVLGAQASAEGILETRSIEKDVQSEIARLNPGDVVCVTSRRAAAGLRGCVLPDGVRLAAVGRGTEDVLREHLRAPDHVVESGGGAELARSLSLPPDASVLYPCAQETSGELERVFAERGVSVSLCVLYASRASFDVDLDATAPVRVYLSPKAARAALAWERAHGLSPARIAWGETTARELSANAITEVDCLPEPHVDSLVARLAQRYSEVMSR